jgi:hypothetical protein
VNCAPDVVDPGRHDGASQVHERPGPRVSGHAVLAHVPVADEARVAVRAVVVVALEPGAGLALKLRLAPARRKRDHFMLIYR